MLKKTVNDTCGALTSTGQASDFPGTSLIQQHRDTHRETSDNINNIYDQTFSYADDDTGVDYYIQDRSHSLETSCAAGYDPSAALQDQDRTFEHIDISGMQTHSLHEETNDRMLMRLARALGTGDRINNYEDTTFNESFIRQSPDTYLLPASTSTPHKSPTDSSISFFTPTCDTTPSSHVLIQTFQDPIPQTTMHTPVKTFTDSATSPIKTQKSKTSMIATGTSPHMKAPLLILQDDDQNRPLAREEEVILTNVIRRKMKTSVNKNTLTFKTLGQPLVFERSVKPRKSSAVANSPLRRRQAKKIEKIRSQISGLGEKDVVKQHISELKRTKGMVRKNLEREMGLSKRKFTPEEALVMKETMNISYHQFKLQSKFLKTIGTDLPNEHAIRTLHKSLAKSDVEIIEKQFDSTKTAETHNKEAAFIKNLPEFVTKILEKHHKNEELTWHRTIPLEEIWIKLGGDHGKGSFKISFHICNISKPNSKDNTHLIAMAKVPDTTNNIEVIINHLKEQIYELASMQWREKTIKLFIFGDYWFLCKLYGLSGPAGSYPCLWCHVHRHQMQNDDSAMSQLRSVESLVTDFENFKQSGSDKQKAKHHHNVIHSPLLNISLDNVSPPYLHILLGLVLKHHNSLEEDIEYFDQEISKEKARILGHSSLFEKYGCNWEKAIELKEEKDFVKACIIMVGTDDRKELKKFQRQRRKIKDSLHELKEEIGQYN
ncbi:amine oxidase [Elysia marginata]|uniref:Amine oxidase n=1 Tax=Elysia marginata TaxID=1093978 RepID=A0AAV4J1E7_9GAST|nr:amine oxidase [Elysia marginata]